MVYKQAWSIKNYRYVWDVSVLPVTSASLRSAWDIGGAIGNMVNLVPCASAPTSVYIALPQGPTNHILVGRPRSGREKGSRRADGLDRVEINLTYMACQTRKILSHFSNYSDENNNGGEHPSSTPMGQWINAVFTDIFLWLTNEVTYGPTRKE
jgi:hypothetical protein